MKLAIKIGSTGLVQDGILKEFAAVLRQFIAEGHYVTVIHGQPKTPDDEQQEDSAFIAAGAQLNQRLLASFGRAGVSAIGFSGGDGHTVRVRTTRFGSPAHGYFLKTALINPFWLDVICRSGGAPVISNVALGPDARYHCLCADQIASACAISWHADALIFLTAEKGVGNGDGAIMRWLYADQITTLASNLFLGDKMLSKLIACHDALRNGVCRTRIFPLSQIQSLSGFFTERLDFGTEIVLAPSHAGESKSDVANTKALPAGWATG